MPRDLKLTPDFSELGRSGLKQYSGYVYEEFLRELGRARWPRIVKEMLWNDPVIASMFFAIEMLIRQVTWDVQSVSSSNEDEEAAQFVEDALNDMDQPWKETLAEILSFLPWGWCLNEKVFKRRNGQNPGTFVDGKGDTRSLPQSKFDDNGIGWAKWGIRAQETLLHWDFYENGDTKAMVQLAPPDFAQRTIPIDKSILFRTTTHKSNPEGYSMLRAVYRPWFFKQRIENIEGIGIERDLAGLPHMQIPAEYLDPNAPPDKAAIADYCKALVTGVRNDEQGGIVTPSDVYEGTQVPMFKFELVSTGGTRQFDTSKIIQRYDQRILMRLMADFLLLGHEKVGSFALASSKTDMFATALGAWLDSICETINRDAIPALLRLNGKPADNPPKLTHGDIESIDLVELGDFIAKLSSSGVTLSPQILSYALEQAGMPVPEDDDELAAMIGPKPAAPGAVPQGKTPPANEPPDTEEE